ncbi:hypothetical protein ACFVGY_06150 [Streptomyces sp. NPDC127106]|uniref:hypothetical protein n=1 Tax=Streptomyces sp. NPDC127106 TaxID=3345360 RepID=UPI00363E7EF0
MLEKAGGGGVVFAPSGLVSKVAEHGGAEVGVASGVGAVEAGDPELARGGVVSVVEAVPGDGLGQRGGQCVEAQASGAVVAAVGDQVGNGSQMGVEQGSDVLSLFGDEAVELADGVFEHGDGVVADEFAAFQLRGERGSSTDGPGGGQGCECGAGDGEEGAAFQVFHGGTEGLSQGGDGAGWSEGDDSSVAAGQPVRPVVVIDELGGQF